MRKLFVIIFSGMIFGQQAWGQKSNFPMIGAQVFIEPGQTPRQIEQMFDILEENHMTVCRIRLFENHMKRDNGTWDYSLYDIAFDAAQKHGIKVFATLFPYKKNHVAVEGFRFPDTEEQLSSIAEYIKAMVTHFAPHPAMYVWVLQNEPGLGNAKKITTETPLSRKHYQMWLTKRSKPEYDNGYLKDDLSEERFLKDYTTWYLSWLSEQVRRYDSQHPHHVNPHGLFNNLPEYDFPQYEKFLGSLGASMHASWHFDLFPREKFPLAVSINSDLIRMAAGHNPFWITEFQGGNVIYSGKMPLCPTAEETTQWIWTGVGAGAQGVIFWTLNQRGSVKEAGEWGMLDYLKQPSDRLLAAAKVASVIGEHRDFFRHAEPLLSDITLLYNPETMWIQRAKESNQGVAYDGKSRYAFMRSMIGCYEALSMYGITPRTQSMESFDWISDPQGKVVILSDLVSIPSVYWKKIDDFVMRGGRLIVLGMTGYFDENMHCIMLTGFPLKKTFGAAVKEFKYVNEDFKVSLDMPLIELPAHMWRGTLACSTAQSIGSEKDETIAAINNYGRGKVIWLPSPVGLGAWRGDGYALSLFLRLNAAEMIDRIPFRFYAPQPGVLMRVLQSGSEYMTIIINKSQQTKAVEILTPPGMKPEIVFGEGIFSNNLMVIEPEQTQVVRWR